MYVNLSSHSFAPPHAHCSRPLLTSFADQSAGEGEITSVHILLLLAGEGELTSVERLLLAGSVLTSSNFFLVPHNNITIFTNFQTIKLQLIPTVRMSDTGFLREREWLQPILDTAAYRAATAESQGKPVPPVTKNTLHLMSAHPEIYSVCIPFVVSILLANV